MIPQRTPRSDFAGTEIKERVTECRKRLRQSRFIQMSEGAEGATRNHAPNATFLDAEPAMRESLLSSNLSSAASAATSDSHGLQLSGETVGLA